MAALHTAALSVPHLNGFDSIREGMQTVIHDTTALLEVARRQQLTNQPTAILLVSPVEEGNL